MLLPAAGFTVMLVPDPTPVPWHEPVDQDQLATFPKLPPVTERVLDVPLHVLLLVIETPVGAVARIPTGHVHIVLHAVAAQP